MADTVSSYRIRTDVGQGSASDYITIDANLVQEYDTLDILSVKIRSNDTYRLHNADYGVVVGRVIANNGFGIPNAKLSIFIASDGEDGEKVRTLYPFTSSASKNSDGVRYNLLPDEKVGDCHQIVGTFPNKRYALDNDVILEVFDKYYKYTTRSNNAGDFLIMGVPTGSHTLHMDLDLSDCGILSQRPRDFVYKGYTVEQFENPNMFKSGTTYQNLSQIFTQDRTVNVKPLWGNSSLGEELGITRADIDVAFVFETTCVFMGSVISDNSSQGITKKCMGTENMGNMEEMVTGEGTIEMIRKTPAGNVEEFQVKGTQLIDADGVWCYQIPMNLDYMMTDEYGNMVPTDDPSKGVATRARVRFRMSMSDTEENVDNYFRAKALVPHNPQLLSDGTHEDYDYEFGTYTREDSYRDLFWNNVYSVKSYIPRFQKRKVLGWKDKRFVAIKNCNFHGTNNPMPYNNIRIKLPFMFGVMCVIVKSLIWITGLWNFVLAYIIDAVSSIASALCGNLSAFKKTGKKIFNKMDTWSFSVLKDGLCPDLDNWYFAPMLKWHYYVASTKACDCDKPDPFGRTLERIVEGDGLGSSSGSGVRDLTSIDETNVNDYENAICLTTKVDYLLSCVEMNLAMEYRVINFDFYNDWVNGTIYFPRFMRFIKPKLRFLGITWRQAKTKGCMDDPSVFSKTRRYTQQCAIGYGPENINGRVVYTRVQNPMKSEQRKREANRIHKAAGFSQITIFGGQGGICHEQKTLQGQNVYYMKPCEFRGNTGDERKINLFATDIILLGSLNDCDRNGIPQAFRYLSSTSYVLPTNLALTNMEENGMLYATDDGTICRGGEQNNYIDTSGGDDGPDMSTPIQVKSQNDGLTGEITYFSGGGADVNLEYDTYELSDLIALTEAAGISWNFTGPGQGDPVEDYMYAPGGHFLGLSCVNAQSNMKSCINLSRICELGANMSQRKEEVFDLDSRGNLKYKYTAPSGFISGNDIVGEDFRTMFATMNHRRLIADRTDPETGYKVYGFDFVHPINFNGAFTEPVNTSSSPYNQIIDVPRENDDVFEELGISTGSGNGRADYDKDEGNNTQIRTVESPDIDYYMFRMGLDYDDLTRNSLRHVNRFLAGTSVAMNINTGTKLYVPQYENSFYFYFGLNVGATAIEKFNEQFFSTCSTDELLTANKTINLSIDGEVMACRGEANIRVVTNNLATPYERILYYMEGSSTGMTVDGTTSEGRQWLNQYVFTIEDLELGTWTVEITDAEGTTVSSSINLINDFVSFEVETYDFLVNANSPYLDDIDNLSLRGGYAVLRNLKIVGIPDDTRVVVSAVDDEGNVDAYGTIDMSGNFGDNNVTLKVSKANCIYNIRIAYRCQNGSAMSYNIYNFMLKDGTSLNMYMGDKSGAHIYFDERFYGKEWWFDNINQFSELEQWIIKYNCFRTTLDDSEPTSNNVIVEKGTKALWGTPQNIEGFYNEGTVSYPLYRTYCSENYFAIPEGYSLDDDMSYHPTVNYKPRPISPYIGEIPMNYYALAYNGNGMVLGTYCAVLSGGTISYVNGGRTWLHNGQGYVFKPLDGNTELQFGEYSNGFIGLNMDNGRITSGVFYPAYTYPVFHRPFRINAHYFLSLYDNSKSVHDETRKAEETESTFLEVHNGITWEGRFKFEYRTSFGSSGSYDIANAGFDMAGLAFGMKEDRIIYHNVGRTVRTIPYENYLNEPDSVWPNDYMWFQLEEGCPEGEEYQRYRAVHEDEINADLPPIVYYTIFSGRATNPYIVYYPAYASGSEKTVSEEDTGFYLWEERPSPAGIFNTDSSLSSGLTYVDPLFNAYGVITPFPATLTGDTMVFVYAQGRDNSKKGRLRFTFPSDTAGRIAGWVYDDDIYARGLFTLKGNSDNIFYDKPWSDVVFNDDDPPKAWESFFEIFFETYPEYIWLKDGMTGEISMNSPNSGWPGMIEDGKYVDLRSNKALEINNAASGTERYVLMEFKNPDSSPEIESILHAFIHESLFIEVPVYNTAENDWDGRCMVHLYPRALDNVLIFHPGRTAISAESSYPAHFAPITVSTTWFSLTGGWVKVYSDVSWITIDGISETEFIGSSKSYINNETMSFYGEVNIEFTVLEGSPDSHDREGHIRFKNTLTEKEYDAMITVIAWGRR